MVVEADEKHQMSYLSDLFSVIVAIEKLEKANHRDLVTAEEYEPAIQRLLDKYQTIVLQLQRCAIIADGDSAHVGTTTSTNWFRGVDVFWQTYCSNMFAAKIRVDARFPTAKTATPLTNSGREGAITPESTGKDHSRKGDLKRVFLITQHFITFMDCLKLNQHAKDQLFPILNDLVNAVRKGAANFSYLPKLEAWMARLEKMHPSDDLPEREVRELGFDMERGYQAFEEFLEAM